jgi:hypothetical protein
MSRDFKRDQLVDELSDMLSRADRRLGRAGISSVKLNTDEQLISTHFMVSRYASAET